MTRIASQLEALQQEITKTCVKLDKSEQNVRLIAVSKRHSAEKIRLLANSGQSDFAENQVQEALNKIQQLSDLAINWHMIGSIQSRKCQSIAQNFAWVQSLDRHKVAHKLSQHRPDEMPDLNICIQLNLFNEQQKSGASASQAIELAELVTELPRLCLRGVMALPPKVEDSEIQFNNFLQIADFYQQLATTYPTIDTLSMGMSNDYPAAIAAGSTMLRLGTVLFGQRDH